MRGGLARLHLDEPDVREQIGRFRDRWRHNLEDGYVSIVREYDGRRRLIEMVQTDLNQSLCPPSRRPVLPRAMRKEPARIDDPATLVKSEEVSAWVGRDPFVREGLSRGTAARLAWMEREFAQRAGSA